MATMLSALLLSLLPIVLAGTSFPLPPGSHLLLQRPVALPPVTRRQMEMPGPVTAGEREPTCSELRAMWRHMRRMGRQMEFTNEIPKMQDPFVETAVRYGTRGRMRNSRYPDPNPYSAAKSSIAAKEAAFISSQFSNNRFGDAVKNQNEVLPSSNRIIPMASQDSLGFHEFDEYPSLTKNRMRSASRTQGIFSDSSLPEEALGVYGTVVHTPEERAKFRAQTRRPDDYGINRYHQVPWQDSTGMGRVPFRAPKPHTQYHYGSVVTHRHPKGGFAEYPPEIGQNSGAGTRVERIDKIALPGKIKNTCLRLQNKPCKTDVDCFCNGNPKLFCGGDRCRPLFKTTKYGKQKWGKSYKTDSYERNLLGFAPKSDPIWPGPY